MTEQKRSGSEVHLRITLIILSCRDTKPECFGPKAYFCFNCVSMQDMTEKKQSEIGGVIKLLYTAILGIKRDDESSCPTIK